MAPFVAKDFIGQIKKQSQQLRELVDFLQCEM